MSTFTFHPHPEVADDATSMAECCKEATQPMMRLVPDYDTGLREPSMDTGRSFTSGTGALRTVEAPIRDEHELIAQASMILSALDAAPRPKYERRQPGRFRYRTVARLRLFADGTRSEPRTLFVRDCDPRGLGFISPERLPLGYGGWIELEDPSGVTRRLHCTLFRCRETAEGWFEGALYFNRPQADFVPRLDMQG